MNIQRTLPPTAAPLRWRDLSRGLAALCRPRTVQESLRAEFRRYFGTRHVFLLTSGKAALTMILLGLRRISGRAKVVLPGYTCYSVPSAVVKAGLEVSLCDVDPNTLDFKKDSLERSLDEEVLCVVPTHLLGYPADVEQVRSHCRDKGIYVVEDAAQSFGGMRDGHQLGTLGDVAFFSFGRGKNLTCGSGGVIVTDSDAIAEAIQQEYSNLPEESLVGALENWCQLLLMRYLINPWIYWLPAGLPFLKLGETRFYIDFPMMRMDAVRAGLLSGWSQRLAGIGRERREHAEELTERLPPALAELICVRSQDSPAYLRLPVLLKTPAMKTELCAKSKEKGLGISPLYPTSIQDVPELRQQLTNAQVPMSALLAERLVTLPTHCLVSARDVKELVDAVKEVAGAALQQTPQGAPSGSLQRKAV